MQRDSKSMLGFVMHSYPSLSLVVSELFESERSVFLLVAFLATATFSLLLRALEELTTLSLCFLVARQPHG